MNYELELADLAYWLGKEVDTPFGMATLEGLEVNVFGIETCKVLTKAGEAMYLRKTQVFPIAEVIEDESHRITLEKLGNRSREFLRQGKDVYGWVKKGLAKVKRNQATHAETA